MTLSIPKSLRYPIAYRTCPDLVSCVDTWYTLTRSTTSACALASPEGHKLSWNPRTEADIRAALEARDVSESNVLDMKAVIGDKDSERRETAKDLASFAVDGGALLIGVAEHKDTRTFEAVPIALHDVIERIEQIAANRVDPPLVVRPREIPSDKEGLGYVWVDIPASPDAPHMVGTTAEASVLIECSLTQTCCVFTSSGGTTASGWSRLSRTSGLAIRSPERARTATQLSLHELSTAICTSRQVPVGLRRISRGVWCGKADTSCCSLEVRWNAVSRPFSEMGCPSSRHMCSRCNGRPRLL